MLISRRGFLKGLGAAVFSGLALSSYAIGIEPARLRTQEYDVFPPRWPDGLELKIVALADFHACQPWMSPTRIRQICDQANALEPDLIVLLGDYVAGHRFVSNAVHSRDWSAALSNLAAPLGVHAILGNHDWWEDEAAQIRGHGPVFSHTALERVGIQVYENDATLLEKGGHGFWLAGLADQLALLPHIKYGRRRWKGFDDLAGTMAKITNDAPIIMMAHEPDIFPSIPDRISLTLSGHTHGGQVRLFGYSPVVPSRFRNRYAYGHIVERNDARTSLPKNLVVSGGLGCSIMPVRFGVPPEITIVNVKGRHA